MWHSLAISVIVWERYRTTCHDDDLIPKPLENTEEIGLGNPQGRQRLIKEFRDRSTGSTGHLSAIRDQRHLPPDAPQLQHQMTRHPILDRGVEIILKPPVTEFVGKNGIGYSAERGVATVFQLYPSRKEIVQGQPG